MSVSKHSSFDGSGSGRGNMLVEKSPDALSPDSIKDDDSFVVPMTGSTQRVDGQPVCS
jgi:hypothetical protein